MNLCSAFKQRAKDFLLLDYCEFQEEREKVWKSKVEKGFRVLEQVLQDVHVLLQCGERMVLGHVVLIIASYINSLLSVLSVRVNDRINRNQNYGGENEK